MMEERNRESRPRESARLDSVPGIAWLKDREGRFLAVNGPFAEACGMAPAEVIGRTDHDIWPRDLAESNRADDAEVMRTGKPKRVEARLTHPDGRETWIETIRTPILDAHETVIGTTGIACDITQRKLAEENLLRHTRGLTTLVEISKSLAATLDLAKVLQATTDGVAKIIGLDTAAVYLLEAETLRLWATTPALPPQFPEGLRVAPLDEHPRIRRAITSGAPVLVPDLLAVDLTPAERSVMQLRGLRTVLFLPLVVETKTVGTLIVGSVENTTEISDAEIDLCRTLANLAALAVENAQLFHAGQRYAAELEQRIAESKRAKESLLESEEKFRAVFDSASDGILIADPRTKRFVLGNAAIARMLGVGREDIPHMSVEQIHPAGGGRDVSRVFEETAQGTASLTPDVAVLCKDGSVFSADVATSFLRMQGAPYVAGLFRDTTPRKRAEQERLELERRLLHSQKLESLGLLAGGIAHDFNNLLMAILANLDLAQRKLPSASSVREHIDHSIQAAHRATDLTRQMLAYSGRGRFVVEALDLSELVEENAHLFRASAARTTSLDLRLGRSLPAIEADAGQVQQVIMNLITNASEAIGNKPGVIVITTGVQDCDAPCLRRSRIEDVPPAGKFVFLEVSDTGCGMDGHAQQRLFDPFFTTKAVGRGLGMSAILGIVRGHRGAVFVESAMGEGTRIRVLFPAPAGVGAVAESASRAPRIAGAGVPPAGGVVLVVDDEESVRKACTAMVESLGLKVITASDGREAVEVFRRNADAISRVILDLSMPNMDGIAALQELVLIRPGVKVILSSGYDEQDAVRRLSSQGLVAFIQKPYTLKELVAALDR